MQRAKDPTDPVYSPPPPTLGFTATFRVNYKAHFGQTLVLCGESSATGSWDPRHGMEMFWNPGHDWEVSVIFPHKREGSFQYKYALKSGDHYSWENGCNRVLRFDPDSQDSIISEDCWRPTGENSNLLSSNAFVNVIFHREPSSPPPMILAGNSPVRFIIEHSRIRANHFLCIGGSHPALGNWDPQKALKMNDSNFPLWEVNVDIPDAPPEVPIEYKYGIYDPALKSMRWEDGSNRSFTATSKKRRLLIRSDSKLRLAVGDWKGTGVALPVFSLRSENGGGIGEFTDLRPLIDWAKEVSISLIQLLPINDTIATHTWLDSYPYNTISVHALHPIYMNIQEMGTLKSKITMQEFLNKAHELNKSEKILWEKVLKLKSDFFKCLYDQEKHTFLSSQEFSTFFEENKEWLVPYAAFSCLRDRFGTSDYRWWPKYSKYNLEEIQQLTNPHSPHYDDFAIHYFIQYHLHKQLSAVATKARQQGVILKGDLPIGISRNSVDAWMEPQYFNFECQTGAPPDDFSTEGQNWGFPTYNWDRMAQDGFSWWLRRLSSMEKYFDAFRIDHILGFFRVWEIPYHCIRAILGQFSPAVSFSVEELGAWGIHIDYDRFCKPYIRSHFLANFVGSENVEEVKQNYLVEYAPNCFHFKEKFKTQRRIFEYFEIKKREDGANTEKYTKLQTGLMELLEQVIFLEVPFSNGRNFSPLYTLTTNPLAKSFQELDDFQKRVINNLRDHYVFHRQDHLWYENGRRKLPFLKSATKMLVFGEDLGDRVPKVVIDLMKELDILSLNIHRMTKDAKKTFFNPDESSYLAVVSTSSHDLSNLREWWNNQASEHFKGQLWNAAGGQGFHHTKMTPITAETIIAHHLRSPAMWAIFPLQDLFQINEEMMGPENTQINYPPNEKHYWRFRFHCTVEEMMKSPKFSEHLLELNKKYMRGFTY